VEDGGGKRVSWVELYLDLIFVLAVGQLSHLIVAEPEMRSVWIALGLFFTLWWTWIGFSVLYNRFGVDAAPQRLLFLAGSIPTGVAAVAIEPASTGDVGVFAVSLAITRLILAGANGMDGGWHELLRGRIAVSYGISALLFVVSIWVPEPFRYVLWAAAIALESGALLREDKRAARRARREHDLQAFAPENPEEALDAHHFAERGLIAAPAGREQDRAAAGVEHRADHGLRRGDGTQDAELQRPADVVSRIGFMNSRAGSGEYSSTSTAPNRSASERMAPASPSSFSWLRDTRPTENPSRPKRRAMARPRFGPAPTITSDMPPRLRRRDDQERVAVGVVQQEHRRVAGQRRAAPVRHVVAHDLPDLDPGAPELLAVAVDVGGDEDHARLDPGRVARDQRERGLSAGRDDLDPPLPAVVREVQAVLEAEHAGVERDRPVLVADGDGHGGGLRDVRHIRFDDGRHGN
jgi:hypothetical protein